MEYILRFIQQYHILFLLLYFCDVTGEFFKIYIMFHLRHSLLKFEFCFAVTLILFHQGAGTAIGELPPYFMAKAGESSPLASFYCIWSKLQGPEKSNVPPVITPFHRTFLSIHNSREALHVILLFPHAKSFQFAGT